MEEHEGSLVISSTNAPVKPEERSSKNCEECKANESKYKCPGCSVRSCSLPCVKAHKQRTGCTGKRQQQTAFVPLSQFDDNLLLSDYNMLEDVKRIADSAKRTRLQLCGKFLHGTPLHLKSLLRAAQNRRTQLLFLPSGMSKRETNRSYYNNRSKMISWTIEWRFHSTNVKLIDHGVNENSNLYSLIENHLKPGPRNHPLKPFCLEQLESLRFFVSKHPKRSRSMFRELDITAPIHEQLSNLVIVEYPVIHVFLPSHPVDFEVVKNPIIHTVPVNKSHPSLMHGLELEAVRDPVAHQAHPKRDPVNESQPSPQGVFFREEEIKDDDATSSHVLDLMSQSSNGKQETKIEEFVHKALDSTNNSNELGDVNLIEFDFDPELIDVYSNLISESNPDDFLDLDGFLCDSKDGVIKEDLEEGEIADSD